MIDVDGLRIFYREVGPRDGPTVLLLHGFPSSRMYEPLLSRLGTFQQILCSIAILIRKRAKGQRITQHILFNDAVLPVMSSFSA